jgi:hypothetical protein
MMDLDFFKAFNTYSHPAGDAAADGGGAVVAGIGKRRAYRCSGDSSPCC